MTEPNCTKPHNIESDTSTPVVRYFLVAAYVIFSTTPALVSKVTQAGQFSGIAHNLAIAFGITGFSIIVLQYVLAARFKWITKPFGLDGVLSFHKFMAVFAAVLLIAHLLLLAWSKRNWGLVASPWASWPIQFGRIAMLFVVAILVVSFARPKFRLNFDDWKWFHNALAWSVLLLGFVHSVAIGASYENTLFAVVWTGYFSTAVFAWLHYRYYRPLQRQRAQRLKTENNGIATASTTNDSYKYFSNRLPERLHTSKQLRIVIFAVVACILAIVSVTAMAH